MFRSRGLLNVFLFLAIAGLGFAAYSAVGPPAAAKAITSTQTVTRGDVLSSVTATGNASAATQVTLSFQDQGTVTAIDVTTGQHVNAGQVLATIQNTSETDALHSAQASLASAQSKLTTDQQGATPQQLAIDQALAQAAD